MADHKKTVGIAVLALAGLGLFAGGPPARKAGAVRPGQASGPVRALIHPRPSGPLADRIAWARGEAKTNRWDKGFWLGFGIRRLMGEHSMIGWHSRGGPEERLTLDDLIHGRKTALEKKVAADQAVRGTLASMPDLARPFAGGRRGDEPERPVLKELGVLLRLTAGEDGFPADIRVSNLDLPFDFGELPFVWAGMATDAESLACLIPLYGQAAGEHDKRSLLWAVGLHREASAVVPFIERILAGKESEEVRAEAAACLGEQNDPRALALLLKTIKTDPSREVRERAVQALADLPGRAGLAPLVNLVETHPDTEIRTMAVEAIGDVGGPEAVKVLAEWARGGRR